MRASGFGLRRQGGYVLLMVLATLTVVAFVATRFAERVQTLRQSAQGFSDYATARSASAGAQAAVLYWMATRPLLPAGRGDGAGTLRQDGRVYAMPGGVRLDVQDLRGLLSLNATDRQTLANLLILDGLEPLRAQAWLDVLEDYLDTDNLKRLNGAERAEYQALGLAGPRNDWLMTVGELSQLPLWRDDPERLARLERWFNVATTSQFNPNTAPPAVLGAVLIGTNPAQQELLLTMRKNDLLTNGLVASRLTGLPLDREDFWFAPGWESRITVWAPGLPRALEYNVRLTPAGVAGPWLLLEQHSAPRPSPSNEPIAAPPFPLPLVAGESSLPASAAASRPF